MSTWYYRIDERELGPVTGHRLKEMAAAGEILRDTAVRRDQSQLWTEAEKVRGLFDSAVAAAASTSATLSGVSEDAIDSWLNSGSAFGVSAAAIAASESAAANGAPAPHEDVVANAPHEIPVMAPPAERRSRSKLWVGAIAALALAGGGIAFAMFALPKDDSDEKSQAALRDEVNALNEKIAALQSKQAVPEAKKPSDVPAIPAAVPAQPSKAPTALPAKAKPAATKPATTVPAEPAPEPMPATPTPEPSDGPPPIPTAPVGERPESPPAVAPPPTPTVGPPPSASPRENSAIAQRRTELEKERRDTLRRLHEELKTIADKVAKIKAEMAPIQKDLDKTQIDFTAADATARAIFQQSGNVRDRINQASGPNENRERAAAERELRSLRTQFDKADAQRAGYRALGNKLQGQLNNLRAQIDRTNGTAAAHLTKWQGLFDWTGACSAAHHKEIVTMVSDWMIASPDQIQLYLLRGNGYLHMGDDKAALADFNKALSLGPMSTAGLTLRGMVYARQRNDKQAMADFSQAIKVNRQYSPAYVGRGRLFIAQKNMPRAKTDLETAFKLEPENPYALNELALLLAASPHDSQRNATVALKRAQTACDLTKRGEWPSLWALSAAQAESGDSKGAVATIDEAVALAPEERRAELAKHKQLFEAGKAFRL